MGGWPGRDSGGADRDLQISDWRVVDRGYSFRVDWHRHSSDWHIAYVVRPQNSSQIPPRRMAYQYLLGVFLLGVFELVLGAMMFVSALERGPHMYWMAAIWSLIGGALILSQALHPNSRKALR